MNAIATTLLILHILSAAIAVGTNVSYLIWLRRAVIVPESREFTLTTVRLLETRLAIPAYVIALATGIGLVLTSPIHRFGIAWIDLSIVLWIVIMALGGFHSRVVKRQLAVADSDSDEYESGHARARILLGLIALCAVGTLYLMVAKPDLWGG